MTALLVSVGLMIVSQAVPASESERVAMGKAALNAGNCAMARKTLEGLSDRAKENAGVVFLLARAYECEKNHQAALDAYRKYDKLVPGNPEVKEAIGRMLFALQQRADDEAARAARENEERERKEKRKEAVSQCISDKCDGLTSPSCQEDPYWHDERQCKLDHKSCESSCRLTAGDSP